MKRFNLLVPDELHKRYKIACAMEEIDMSEAIRKLMQQFVEKVEKKQKKKK
jgi:hypothetical protein